MHSAHTRQPFRHPHNRTAVRLGLAVLISALGLAASTATAQTRSQTGQWSPERSPLLISFGSVHMALLPGGVGGPHSRIVVWGETFAAVGAELNWNADSSDCGTWPYSSMTANNWALPVNFFCGGHAQLATDPGLFVIGGDDHAPYEVWGIRDAQRFAPGTGSNPGSWTPRTDMELARFYPTLTALRDGRMMATGGLRLEQEWYFGGRVDGAAPSSPVGDYLYRFGRGTRGNWDYLVTPLEQNQGDRPSPREGLTAADIRFSAGDVSRAFFGGKEASGLTTDKEVHILRREYGGPLDGDYTYRWSKLNVTGSLPPARCDHTAIDIGGSPTSEMVVYGGLSKPASGGPTTILNDFLRLHYSAPNWKWDPVFVAGGTSPGSRYGHSAVFYDGKMYLFGGSSADGDAPTDGAVYEFTFSTGNWQLLPVAASPRPGPRRDHTLVLAGSSLLLYGGSSDVSPSSNSLWKLDLSANPLAWEEIQTTGPSPGARANHSAFYEQSPEGPRLAIFGGDPPTAGDPSVDNRIYFINPFPAPGSSATWVQGPPATHRLSGHTVVNDPSGVMHAHLPEIYNPSTNAWATQTSSGWFPPQGVIKDYPVEFLVPGTSLPGGGGRVLRVGQDPVSRYLDIPAAGLSGSWSPVPNGSNGSFKPLTGVQYLPGKVLVLSGAEGTPNTKAKTIDVTTMQNAHWVDQPDVAGRADPNMVMLPNGKVLVLGDIACPQIWDPGTGTWTAGNPCALATDDVRGYHSTAMLLPDGRVLSDGPSADMRVYCPPYLFNSNSLATRPTLASAPASVVYGESFEVGKTFTDQISSVCLIRPAAVTHSFDQNGRYVPLSFDVLPDANKLQVRAPTDGSVAPPGDYLLFILNSDGVPGIAKWIHLGNCSTVPCDAGSPPQASDFSPDIVGPHEVWMLWTAPGDDRTPASGEYDLRYAATGSFSDHVYSTATAIPDEPAVAAAGTPMSYTISNLAECTTYSFGLKTRDRLNPSTLNNWSLLSSFTVSTSCGGAGGGFAARRVDNGSQMTSATATARSQEGGEGPSSSTSGGAQPAAMLGLAPGGGLLIAETRRTQLGGWQIVLYSSNSVEGISAADAGFIVSQRLDAGGLWATLGRFQPSGEPGPLGLCALRAGGRMVLPAGFGLDRVVTGLRVGGEDLGLAHATHSRLGDLGNRLVSTDSTLVLAAGDSITLDYQPSATALAEAANWYLLVRPVAVTGEAQVLHRLPGGSLPLRFALHAARPNPAIGATVIPFDLPRASSVRIEVFDLLGRRVRVLTDGDYLPGEHAVAWDGRRDDGTATSSGVYLYRMTAGGFRAQQAVALLGK